MFTEAERGGEVMGLLIFGGALLAVVALTVLTLIIADLTRPERGHWLNSLREWQGLVGSMLGFVSAASVFVLSAGVTGYQEELRRESTNHSLGLALAFEVERLALGLQVVSYMGSTIPADDAAQPATCMNYLRESRRALAANTPIWDASLTRLVDFSDATLLLFARFYTLYGEFIRGLPDIDQAMCDAQPADEIGFVFGQAKGAIMYYQAIASHFDVAPVASQTQLSDTVRGTELSTTGIPSPTTP